MYYIEVEGTIVKTTYESKGAAAKFLNVQHGTITDHLDKWIKGGIKGNYIFSYELDNLELEKLMELSSLSFACGPRPHLWMWWGLFLRSWCETCEARKFNNCRLPPEGGRHPGGFVWVYNASTLELLLDSFRSMQKAADERQRRFINASRI